MRQIIDKIQQIDVPLDLKGSTRGRAFNLKTGRPGTQPSNQPLHYVHSQTNQVLNLSSLLLSFRPYFGLVLSKLYKNQPGKKLNQFPTLKESCKPRSLLWKILHRKKPKLPYLRFDLYNSGSRMNELFLSIQTGTKASNLQLPYPNLYRDLKVS
jgi:hypothetical protein